MGVGRDGAAGRHGRAGAGAGTLGLSGALLCALLSVVGVALLGGVRLALLAVPVFVGSYLAVWALAGLVVYAVDRPHGPVAAGLTLTAAGAYELTPLKQQFRRRCRD